MRVSVRKGNTDFNESIFMKKLIAHLVFVVCPFSLSAQDFAQTVCAGKVVPIMSLTEVLYKPSNLHGGRGPSFLVQNVSERTNKQVLEIRNARCEVIATIGLFRTDQPYGSRYYMRSGGTGQDANELLALASQVGSTNILIEGVNGKWIRIKNPNDREGTIRK